MTHSSKMFTATKQKSNEVARFLFKNIPTFERERFWSSKNGFTDLSRVVDSTSQTATSKIAQDCSIFSIKV